MKHDLMKKIHRRTMTESLRVLEEVGSLRAIVTTMRMRMSSFLFAYLLLTNLSH